VHEHRGRFGVEPICRTLGVSASAFYHRETGQRSARRLEDERLLEVIRETHEKNYEAYGYRRTGRHSSEPASRFRAARCSGSCAPRAFGEPSAAASPGAPRPPTRRPRAP
jgi:hypothetical protein